MSVINWSTEAVFKPNTEYAVLYLGRPDLGDPPTLKIHDYAYCMRWGPAWVGANALNFPRMWAPVDEVMADLMDNEKPVRSDVELLKELEALRERHDELLHNLAPIAEQLLTLSKDALPK